MPYNEKLTNRIRDTLARKHNNRLCASWAEAMAKPKGFADICNLTNNYP